MQKQSLRSVAEILRVTKHRISRPSGPARAAFKHTRVELCDANNEAAAAAHDEAQAAEKIALFTRRAADVRRVCLRALSNKNKKYTTDATPDDVLAAVATLMNDARRVLRGLEQQVAAFQKIKVKQAAAGRAQ